MKLIAVSKVVSTSIPGSVMCYCQVNHGTEADPQVEDNMPYAFDPNDVHMGAFGRSVGAWLETNEGNYTIEDAK